MIEFEDKKYGKAVIFEKEDIYWYSCERLEDYEDFVFWDCRTCGDLNISKVNIVGFRNIKLQKVKIMKNRFGPLEDYEIEQFVLNYKVKEEIFDPILSRFEILDIK